MILNEATFLLYAARYYDNPNATGIDEFREDLMRMKYLKKLLYNYKNKGVLKERLILNHLLVLYNVFEARACTKMLMLKLEDYLDCIFPFLMMLGYLPHRIEGVELQHKIKNIDEVVMDTRIITELRKILKDYKKYDSTRQTSKEARRV